MRSIFAFLATLVLASGAWAQTTGKSDGPGLGTDLDHVLTRLQASLTDRPIKTEGQLCLQYSKKGYESEQGCREDARKYVSRALDDYVASRRIEAKNKATDVARARSADSADLWPFSLTDEELTKVAGPETYSLLGDRPVRQRLIELHQRAVDPYLSVVAAKVEQRIVQEYDDAGLSNEALQEAQSQCVPWVFQTCFGNCVKRPLDNLKSSTWNKLKGICETKKGEVPIRRCKAAAESADPDNAFDHQRFAVHGNQGRLEDFNFANFVCSAGMEGVQVRLRQSGWIFKKRWLEFGTVGEGDTIAVGNLEAVKRSDGIEIQLIKSLDRRVPAFAGPDDLVPCLNINASNEELLGVKDAVVGGLLVAIGVAEGGGNIVDAILRAGKVDKCRADVKAFVKQ